MEISELLYILALGLLGLGGLTFLAGLVVLISRVMGDGVARIANETKEIVQKGIAEEVAGLVGNASVLLNSLNELVRTTTGIGVFLMLTGALFIAGAFYLLFQLQ